MSIMLITQIIKNTDALLTHKISYKTFLVRLLKIIASVSGTEKEICNLFSDALRDMNAVDIEQTGNEDLQILYQRLTDVH